MNEMECGFIESFKSYKSLEIKSRNIDFLIKWLHDVYKIAYLPCTDPNLREKLAVDKVKLSIFNILLDDLADNSEIRDKELLEEAIKISKNGSKKQTHPYLILAQKMWEECIESIKQYPRYEEFKEIFDFDMDQFVDSIKYSYLVNTNGIDNDFETQLYSAHNMMVMIFTDMDIMCSPDFDRKELRKIRPIQYSVQEITHIGNIVATYPREIKEKDYSSPIINYAIREGIIQKETVENEPETALRKLEALVPFLKMKVECNFEKIEEQAKEVKTVDVIEFSSRVRLIWEGFLNRAQNWKTTEIFPEDEPQTTMTLKPTVKIVHNNAVKWLRI